MRRAFVMIAVVGILFFVCPLVSRADFVEDTLSDYRDIIPEGESDPSDAEALSDSVGIKAFLRDIILAINGQRGEIFSFFATVLSVSLLCALSSSLLSSSVARELSAVAESAVSAIGAVMIYEQLRGLVVSVTATLGELSGFFGAVIPVMTVLTASGGGTGTASVQAAGMSLTLGAIGIISSKLLLPMVSVIFALSLVGALSSDGAVSSLAVSVKHIFIWIIGILSAVMLGSLSLQTVIASAADSMAMRTAKYAAAGMIPIVGSTVSASLATLANALSYAKSAVGVSAVSVLVGICVAPLVRLLLCRFSFELCIGICGFFSPAAVKHLTAMRSALDALAAVFSMCAVVCAVEIILFMKCGVALL